MEKVGIKKKRLNNINYLFSNPAPEEFSFINNVNETVSFFSDIDRKMLNKTKNKIYIDLSQVKKITVDVIMYLIAKIKKLQYKKLTFKSFSGNVPKDVDARKVLIESGFFDFVNSKTKTSIKNEKISISSGTTFDREQSRKICDFIIKNSSYKRDDVYFIYEMLSEMMSNTNEHAYNDVGDNLNKWYLYAEKNDNFFEFIFLDTGVGIPTSINKRLFEKIISNDSKLLLSALNGEYRSSTKLRTRGKGLNYIKNCARKNHISTLFVISNKGIVKFEDSKLMYSSNVENDSLEGTLYYWKLIRR